MVLVYDGECEFCCRCAGWVAERVRVDMSPGTSEDLQRLDLSSQEAKRSLWWIDGDLRLAGHKAVAKIFRDMGGAWRVLGTAMIVPPISWIAALCYRLVAGNRHRFTKRLL